MRTALALAIVLMSGPALASTPDRDACIAAADEGQRLRDDGKLTAAREQFLTCASKSCPGVVAKECTKWLVELEPEIPSVTFRARDEQGVEALDVRVYLDGRLVSESIEARALPVDPGEHAVRFERDGKTAEGTVVVRPAEKNRIIELSFAPPKSSPTAPGAASALPASASSGFRIPALAWGGIAVAVAGAAMTVGFAVAANDDETRLRQTCAPNCLGTDRDAIDSKLLFANVGMGVTALGVGVAVVSTVLANKDKPVKNGRPSLVIMPSLAAAQLGVVGAF